MSEVIPQDTEQYQLHSPIVPQQQAAPSGNLPLVVIGLFVGVCGLLAMLLGTVLECGMLLRARSAIGGVGIPLLVFGGIVLLTSGAALTFYDLFALLPRKRTRRFVSFDEVPNRLLTVVLTAYNDEASIAVAVKDFIKHPLVKRVIVVDNNSKDGTAAQAASAGAQVVGETKPGYGQCVFRALSEGIEQCDTDLTLLCEGDGTFSAFDVDKFLAYIPHADIVNGTRIVEQLRDHETQLTTFMYYGNFAVGKLLELKHLGKGTFTDVGTTYKLCRNSTLRKLLPRVDPNVNLEFNAHFLDTALTNGFSLVECPVTFHKRIGVSKGGNTDDFRAFRVGLKMIRGILFSWQAN